MKKQKHIEEVSVKCHAIADGYRDGRVIKADEEFMFNGPVVNGKFPLWCKPLKEYETEFSKLQNKKEDEVSDEDVDNFQHAQDLAEGEEKLNESNNPFHDEDQSSSVPSNLI